MHPLLAVKGLQGSFTPLDFQLGVIDHEELLASIKCTSFNLRLHAPLAECMESLSHHSLFIGHFQVYHLDYLLPLKLKL